MLFNTHTHVDTNRQFQHDRDDVVARARDMGVTRMMVIGYNREAVGVSVAFAERYDWVWAAVGIHPTDALEWNSEVAELLRKAAANPKVRAIGEVGLDYYWKDRAPFDLQRDVFRQQIRLSREARLPLCIHDRDAHDDVVRILEEEHAEEVGGIMHCFAGDWAVAERCLALGFYLGVGGTVTYKNNPVGQDVVRRMPLDRLVLETDDPYLSPMPFRGKRNEPGYVKYVAEFVAQLRGTFYEEIAAATYANANRALGLE
ncbi:MAG TPA: TatD family hydrolase [Symbiobacteriaceae bacterium]|nr:TatD family hydrolase [Symbiobacteriaceae bacterium]